MRADRGKLSMNHRERAVTALNHKEPDRVPIDLGSNRNTSILIEPYQALVAYLGVGETEVERDDFGMSKIAQVAKPDESVLRRLEIDFRGIFLGKPDNSRERTFPDGRHEDELGVVRKRPPSSHYYDVVESPFDRDVTLSDITNWDWPDPADPGYTRHLRPEALTIRETTDYALVLHLQDIIVHASQFMRGFERWYLDFALNPELICSLMDAILEIRIPVMEKALEEVGDLIDVVSSSDDVADQRGSIISPEMYRKYIKPRHKKFFDRMRSKTGAKILYHSCGAVAKLIPDFIDLGIEFINPVQTSAAGMDTARLKKEFGQDIGFWGGIDTMQILPNGSPEDVRAEVKRCIQDLAPGGGYVLAAVHNIQPDVPPENIVAMFEAAREFGDYSTIGKAI
jgi:uroporphyrinogen decarboxylase